MWNRRIAFLIILAFLNVFIYGESKLKKIEELEIGTPSSEIYKEFGEPNSFYAECTNRVIAIYKVSDNESYRLYYTYSMKLYKLTKVINGKEYIIFMDTRVK